VLEVAAIVLHAKKAMFQQATPEIIAELADTFEKATSSTDWRLLGFYR
jgi:hypothetical protein